MSSRHGTLFPFCKKKSCSHLSISDLRLPYSFRIAVWTCASEFKYWSFRLVLFGLFFHLFLVSSVSLTSLVSPRILARLFPRVVVTVGFKTRFRFFEAVMQIKCELVFVILTDHLFKFRFCQREFLKLLVFFAYFLENKNWTP